MELQRAVSYRMLAVWKVGEDVLIQISAKYEGGLYEVAIRPTTHGPKYLILAVIKMRNEYYVFHLGSRNPNN